MKNLHTASMIALPGLAVWIMACLGMCTVFGRDLAGWAPDRPTGVPATSTPIPAYTPVAVPSTASAGDTWIRPADGAVMVYVPAGEFLMGSDDRDPDAGGDEKPQHTVYVDAFWIDRTEVTNAQYRQCVERGPCQAPRYWDDDKLYVPDQPVMSVSWHDAQAYAEWVGGRLPAEAEWEKAARGTDGRLYPWGNSAPDCSKANYEPCGGSPLPVGARPDGASPYGVLDMAGNVPEWVADWYEEAYYSRSDLSNPTGPDAGSFRVARGGSFLHYGWTGRCAHRDGVYPINRHSVTGFRVAAAPGGR